MLELPYWNILENHVVDSMHNLLLGLLKWHCTRFWQMSDDDDEVDPESVSKAELKRLQTAAKKPAQAPKPRRPDPPNEEETGTFFWIFCLVRRPNQMITNSYLLPALMNGGGQWVPPL
jgi:hypothetical protein